MNPYWGKKFGSYSPILGFIIKVKRKGPSSNSSKGKPKTDQKLLSLNALAKGYHNGRKVIP